MRLLVLPEVDVNARTKEGETALGLAKEHGHDDVVKLLGLEAAGDNVGVES